MRWFIALGSLGVALAVSKQQCLTFDSGSAFALVESGKAIPIITSTRDDTAVHIAAVSFALDVEKVTGARPVIVNDTAPTWARSAIIVGSVHSEIVRGMGTNLTGQWESYDMRVVQTPMDGVSEALVIAGSDRRGAIYGMYELSEQMGISPWWWWADVKPDHRDYIGFTGVCAHGEPHVKYRGLFINDEQPALWSWAMERFGNDPPFQTQVYQPVFETLLRLKANYLWPAMWSSMFDVDGMDVTGGLPQAPTAGPNQRLAQAMGIVMGTSHHEPMARNQPEWNAFGTGEWEYTKNAEVLNRFWQYGAERARSIDAETVFTVGMRGNGDLPLPGADIEILHNITSNQQAILRETFNGSGVPQTWCMYKEVMSYFADGLEVPDDVTVLLADDNWGNLMAVMPWGSNHSAGGGVYYHVDYVGDPRNYKWINSAPLAKMWEQMNVASVFNTTDIWILNVGDLKMNELPAEYFLSLAYDSEAWPLNTLEEFLAAWAGREFGGDAAEVADIMGRYQFLSSLLKAELVEPESFSLINYDEADAMVKQWRDLEERAQKVHSSLSPEKQTGFYELVYAPIMLNANLRALYVAVAKSNMYASQFRTCANREAQYAQQLFTKDAAITAEFESLEDGKWPYMLSQPHINYQYWQQPMRNTLPPVSTVQQAEFSYPGSWTSIRYTVENSFGAWPGDNQHNCAQGYSCPDPTLLPMDPYGAPSRWVDVASGGPQEVEWTATTNVSWLKIEPSSGRLSPDGSTDTRVYLTPDWFSCNATHALVNFTSSDGATTIVTLPVNQTTPPPDAWHGFVAGDGYVAMEAAHASANTSTDGYAFDEIRWFGRTASGVKMFPVSNRNFTLGEGPSLVYDFWSVGEAFNTTTGTVQITVQISPALNYILGSWLTFGLQLDDAEPRSIAPIPDTKPGNLPKDWGTVVANEIRNVTMEMPLSDWATPGPHKLTLWGTTTGIVFERVIVDMGGVAARGYSYLGPPESKRV